MCVLRVPSFYCSYLRLPGACDEPYVCLGQTWTNAQCASRVYHSLDHPIPPLLELSLSTGSPEGTQSGDRCARFRGAHGTGFGTRQVGCLVVSAAALAFQVTPSRIGQADNRWSHRRGTSQHCYLPVVPVLSGAPVPLPSPLPPWFPPKITR